MKVKVKNMSWDNEQKKEIETIKERKITVRLSDAVWGVWSDYWRADREFCRRFSWWYLLKRK